MNKFTLHRMSIEGVGDDAGRAIRVARRAAELLGREPTGGASRVVRRIVVEIPVGPGTSDEGIARRVVEGVTRRLVSRL